MHFVFIELERVLGSPGGLPSAEILASFDQLHAAGLDSASIPASFRSLAGVCAAESIQKLAKTTALWST